MSEQPKTPAEQERQQAIDNATAAYQLGLVTESEAIKYVAEKTSEVNRNETKGTDGDNQHKRR